MVQLHELIFRDAHQSMLATRMRTEDMLPIAETIDQIGFFSFEVWGGATFDVPIRYLNEDPWVRINKLKEAMPNTPMQMLERAMNIVAYWNFPDDIVRNFIRLAKRNGVDNFRIFDALNDLRNMKVPIEAVKENGGHAQGCLSYTISPVHTTEYYIEEFKKLERMGCDTLCIKDMAGMISPRRAFDIVKGCKEGGIKAPIDLHSHCTSGMTGMAYMWACDAGVDILDTAMSPISGGTAGPPTESVVAALRDTPYDTGYDMDLLIKCRKYFLKVWDKYRHLHRINALKVDPEVTVHQIPGGMLSNLIFQLEEQGAGDKYFQVLDETARVRKEMGYPPLVTPTSQVVGVQAVMNVIFGRYKKIPKETKDYCMGLYGKPPAPIDENIMEIVLGKNWRDEVIECRPADLKEPMWKKRKEELDAADVTVNKEEDYMTYAIYPQVGLKFLKGEAIPEFTSDQLPLPMDHKMTRSMVAAMFPGVNDIWLETEAPEARKVGGPAPIPTEFDVEVHGEIFDVKINPKRGYIIAEGGAAPAAAKPKDVEGGMKAAMQGTILKVLVKSGDEIDEGDTVAVIEAMKMEQEIHATHGGTVKEIFVEEGDSVGPNDIIVQIL